VTRILVTTSGIAAWLVAIALIVRWRDTRRQPAAVAADASVGDRMAQATGRVAGTAAAAMVAGILVPGLVGRLMMRVLAVTSPEEAQGRITDADEVVGEVTVGGTISLVVFVGLFGGVLAMAGFAVVRRWLPQRSLLAGLLAAGLGGGLLARPSGLLDPDNRDFAILEPTWLAVAFAVALMVTFALLGAVLIDRWAPSWPRPGRSVRGVAAVTPLLPLVLAGPPGVAVVTAIGFRTLVSPAVERQRWLAPVDQVLRVVVLVAAVAGAVWVAASAAAIL
jgi:hypothetical protein